MFEKSNVIYLDNGDALFVTEIDNGTIMAHNRDGKFIFNEVDIYVDENTKKHRLHSSVSLADRKVRKESSGTPSTGTAPRATKTDFSKLFSKEQMAAAEDLFDDF